MLLQPECSPTFSESRINGPLALLQWSIFIQWDGTGESHPTSVPTSVGFTCFLLWCECFCPLRFHPQVPKESPHSRENSNHLLMPPQLPLLPPQRSRAQFASLKWPSTILCHLAQHWAAEQSREQMAELNKYILAQKGLSSPKREPSGNDCSWLYAFKNNHHTGECELRTQFPHSSAVAITLHWMRQCILCWWQKVYMAIVVCIEMAPIGSYTWMLGH